jgi:hypothetical protein
VGRIVRTESGATRRQRILSAMAQALRAVAQRSDVSDGETREVLAFLALSLSELSESVEETAAAWERREYWLKADRFRLEWAPIQAVYGRLDLALRAGDLSQARSSGTDLARLLAEKRLRPLKSSSTPWRGAWDAWLQKS